VGRRDKKVVPKKRETVINYVKLKAILKINYRRDFRRLQGQSGLGANKARDPRDKTQSPPPPLYT